MKTGLQIVVFIIVAGSILFHAGQAYGQAGIDMELSAEYEFGQQIMFTAKLSSPVQIQSAAIFIFDGLQGITYTQPVAFDANGISQYRFDTSQSSLRPFTTMLWRYEFTLANGTTVQSTTMSIRYDDNRFPWRVREGNGLRIHWYEGDDQFSASALNAGQAGLDSINSFFPIDLSRPVDVYIYASTSDLRGTLAGSESWVAGHADSPAGVVMVTIEPGVEQNILMEQRIPHELMHVMLYRQVGDGYKNIPAWLREGTAVLAEVYPNPEYDRFLMDAAGRDALIPMLDLCASFSPNSDSAFLAYAQSRSFTNYLRGLYGSDVLVNLANIYASGVNCERGIERAFGVSLTKLERDWHVNALGQNNITSALANFAPYLALLCLVILFPLIGILNSMRKKGNPHGPETYAKR